MIFALFKISTTKSRCFVKTDGKNRAARKGRE
jgi:hypothetical protein